jgi:hypothetical protein
VAADPDDSQAIGPAFYRLPSGALVLSADDQQDATIGRFPFTRHDCWNDFAFRASV